MEAENDDAFTEPWILKSVSINLIHHKQSPVIPGVANITLADEDEICTHSFTVPIEFAEGLVVGKKITLSLRQ